MITNSVSSCIALDNVEETKDFYIKHFGAQVTFDCGWYVNLSFGNESASLCLMDAAKCGQKKCSCDGFVLNFMVDDVDAEYNRLKDKNLDLVMPIENHGWGDRSFALKDLNGLTLYIYSLREPDDEFKKFYKLNTISV